MAELGIGPDDIAKLEPEISYITTNADEITVIGLFTDTGYQIAFASLYDGGVDSDSVGGVSAALTLTAKMAIQAMFNEQLSETIVRAGNGYLIVTQAGRFILAIAGLNVDKLMKNVKILRVAAQRIGTHFPAK